MAQCNLTATSGNGSAERQYIGARYVPQFFENPNGTWDWLQGVAYEPLTIVKYAENSYTSKKKVPANVGSPNLNPEYWAQTGNYNGVTNNLQEQINDINDNINDLKIENVLVIADSYGVVTTGNPAPWCTTFKTIMEARGINCDVFAQAGSGFVGNGSVPTFEELLDSATKSSYDVVIVQGFLNDMPSGVLAPTFNAAVVSFRNKLNSKYPKCTSYFLPVSKVITNNNIAVVRNICNTLQLNGLSAYFPAWSVLCNASQMQADNTHPNTTGSNNLLFMVLNMLSGGATFCNFFNNSDAFAMVTGDMMRLSIKGAALLTQLKDGHNFRENITLNPLTLLNNTVSFNVVTASSDNEGNLYITRIMQTGGTLSAYVIPGSTEITGAISDTTMSLPSSIDVVLPCMYAIPG